jgi:hypothetical protein
MKWPFTTVKNFLMHKVVNNIFCICISTLVYDLQIQAWDFIGLVEVVRPVQGPEICHGMPCIQLPSCPT